MAGVGDKRDDDTDVLFPERVLSIAGEDVTVREFTFLEGIRLDAKIQPLLDGFEAAAEDDATGAELMATLLVDHQELMIELLATCSDRDVEWVESLSDSDGQDLMWTFWQVNRRFFLRRIGVRRISRDRKAKVDASGGASSLDDSSPTGTTGSNSDDAIRGDS